jgi:glycosyl transferase family 25
LGLSWQFLDAATGLIDGVTYDPGLSLRHVKRQLVAGEIGCFCSHVQAWRELLGNPEIDQMIVLEDDVYADWTFLAEVSGFNWAQLGMNYMKFFPKYPAKFKVLKWSFPIQDRHLVQYTSLALGTGAYLITRWAAAQFERQFKTITRPIDLAMDRPWATGVPVTGIVPVAAVELALPSSILRREQPDRANLQVVRYYAGRVVEHTRAQVYAAVGPKVKVGALPA